MPEHQNTGSHTLPVRIIIPVGLTIVLFSMTIFLLVIPMLEENMMEGKRENIMHLTESAWSILSLYHDRAGQGMISPAEARAEAIRHLRHLRYGADLKDYFWINDMGPVMVMHPYRPDLVGKDIAGFQDLAGKYLFREMVELVKERDAGFVDYLWQWKEDSDRIVPKISYVKGFQPWGWIIGTGIYVEDVRAQISKITRHLTWTCLGIMALALCLSFYIIREAAKEKQERVRATAQSLLREKQLLQADKMSSLGILVAGVAHEINNPATSLMLNAPNLKKAWKSFLPVLDNHFEQDPGARVCNMAYSDLRKRIDLMLAAIEDGSIRIKRIISELKDFSRPVSGDMDHDIDVSQLVEKSLDLTASIVKKATRNLSVECKENLPGVRGNFQKLQQVVINLIVNAAQALENPDQAIRAATFADREGGFLVIEIADTGPGVSPGDLKRMKDPFFTTRRDEGGTGLGLSISEKIISDHGGMLEFSSVPGQGLTARILLPLDLK
ncbi:cache domain-containing protein [Desulfospira joergensenii]|uniref:cache domain-containing protein n=1 Tax=Desulfospira joergensenii TaxID=53329 RepID=UPI0003B56904|nr:cache domain-containing protein [Desulfospira joergensenii]